MTPSRSSNLFTEYGKMLPNMVKSEGRQIKECQVRGIEAEILKDSDFLIHLTEGCAIKWEQWKNVAVKYERSASLWELLKLVICHRPGESVMKKNTSAIRLGYLNAKINLNQVFFLRAAGILGQKGKRLRGRCSFKSKPFLATYSQLLHSIAECIGM